MMTLLSAFGTNAASLASATAEDVDVDQDRPAPAITNKKEERK